MPRSRNNRSASPQNPASSEPTTQQEKIFQNVQEMFSSTVDAEVIHMVLIECQWRGEEAIDKLLEIAENVEAQKQYKQQKSQLRKIAEGVFGPLHSKENESTTPPRRSYTSVQIPASALSQTEKIIRRPPAKVASDESPLADVSNVFNGGRGASVGAAQQTADRPAADEQDQVEQLQTTRARINSPSILINDSEHFPSLPTKSSRPPSVKSSGSSQKSSYSNQLQYAASEAAAEAKQANAQRANLIMQAQSVYQQQYDDAASAQRWEEYKHIISEQYIGTLADNQGAGKQTPPPSAEKRDGEVRAPPSVDDTFIDPAIVKAHPERPRSESSRSFPVRLLSKSPEEAFGDAPAAPTGSEVGTNFPQKIAMNRLDSADFDETVLKCIYEVHDDLLDENELEKYAKPSQTASVGQADSVEAERSDSGTPDIQGQARSNTPMTLPVIGLSVEAAEFVPRTKISKPEKGADVSSVRKKTAEKEEKEVAAVKQMPASAHSASAHVKVSRSNAVEIKKGIKEKPLTSPTGYIGSPTNYVGSPIAISPVLSPALSPSSPNAAVPNNSANYAGSPMFITPKWTSVYRGITTPPPPLQPAVLAPNPRYVAPPPRHLPQPGYHLPLTSHLPPSSHLPFTSRVYTVAPPPIFRVAGPPPMAPLRPPPLHPPSIVHELEDRAAIATGQPIMATGQPVMATGQPLLAGQPLMATSEASRLISPPTAMYAAGAGPLVNQAGLERYRAQVKDLIFSGKKLLVIVRGLPGSGKTTLSRFQPMMTRTIQHDGVVLSTDDYFMRDNKYNYNPDKLTEAHQWNRERAKEAMKMGTNPIIVDNTSTQKWEFKPYISMAQNYGYHVELMEPCTPWKFHPKELARRTLHGVPKDQIERMLGRYEHNVSDHIKAMLNSKKKSSYNSSKSRNEEKSSNENQNADTSDASADHARSSVQHSATGADGKTHEEGWTTDGLGGGEDSWDMTADPVAAWTTQAGSPRSESLDRSTGSSHSASTSAVCQLSGSGSSFVDEFSAALHGHEKDSVKGDDTSKGREKDSESDVGGRHGEEMTSTPKPIRFRLDSDSEISAISEGSMSRRSSSKSASPIPSIFSNMGRSKMKSPQVGRRVNKSHAGSAKEIKIKEIEAKLSPDSVKMVDDIVSENVHDRDMSDEELVRVEEELKALLQLFPLDDNEREMAEILVSLKLNAGKAEETITEDALLDLLEERDTDIQNRIVEENDDNILCSENDATQCLDSVVSISTPVNNENVDIDVLNVAQESSRLEIDIEDNESHPILKSTADTCTNIGTVQKSEVIADVSASECSLNETISSTSSSDLYHDAVEDVTAVVPSTELLYWSKGRGLSSPATVEKVEAVSTQWTDDNDGNKDWDGETDNMEKGGPEDVKSQRKKPRRKNDKNSEPLLSSGPKKSSLAQEEKSCKELNVETKVNTLSVSEEARNDDATLGDNAEEGDVANIDEAVDAQKLLQESVNDQSVTVRHEEGSDHVEVESATVGAHTQTQELKLAQDTHRDSHNGTCIDHHVQTDLLVSSHDDAQVNVHQTGTETNVPSSEANSGVDMTISDGDVVLNVDDTKSCQDIPEDTALHCDESKMRNDMILPENNSLHLIANSYKEIESQESKREKSDISIEEISHNNIILTDSTHEDLNSHELSLDIQTDGPLKGTQGGAGDSTCAQTESVEQDDALASPDLKSTPDKRKKSKRKTSTNYRNPLFNNEDKQKFLSTDWNKLVDNNPTIDSVVSSVESTQGVERNDKSTLTEACDFKTLNVLSQGGFIDSSLTYLTARARKLVTGSPERLCGNVEEVRIVGRIHVKDQSSSTHDLKEMSDSENVAFMKTCFPNVTENELECVLVSCGDNVQWAIDLLLDWEYSSDLSETEKKMFVTQMTQVQLNADKPSTVKDKEVKEQPKCLLDLCFDLIEYKKIASREEVEQQMISTGKERLDRIEGDNITRIRLQRSNSLNEPVHVSSMGSLHHPLTHRSISESGKVMLNEVSCEDLKRPENLNKITLQKLLGSQLIDTESVEKVLIEDVKRDSSVEISKHTDKAEESGPKKVEVYKHKKEDVLNEVAIEQVVTTEGLDHPEARDEVTPANSEAAEDVPEEGLMPALSITLDAAVIEQLESLYGPVDGTRKSVRRGVSVPVDHNTAWQLYRCLVRGARDPSTGVKQQLLQDEELARRLQQEEEEAGHTRKARSVRGVSMQQGGGAYRGARPKVPVRSLAEIMQEEQQNQSSEKEIQRLMESGGSHLALATKMKRQKLYERFPWIDRTQLDAVFQANGFNLTETEESIEQFVSQYEPVQEVMTDEVRREYEDRMLEETKQQSLQDMLNSYLYTPMVSKDYQDSGGDHHDYHDYRGEANVHYRLRHECFQKAKEAYRRGLKQVASFYSQQGHLHTQKIKEANVRASEQILEDRNSDLEHNQTLDLHGLHVDEAISALDKIIPQKERERQSHLTIITGRGSHSRGGVARLRPSVKSYLQQKRYNFSETQTGVFRVPLRYRSPDM